MPSGVTDFRGVFAPRATPDTPVVLLGGGPGWLKHAARNGSLVSLGSKKMMKVIDSQAVSVCFVQHLIDEHVLGVILIKWQHIITVGLHVCFQGYFYLDEA